MRVNYVFATSIAAIKHADLAVKAVFPRTSLFHGVHLVVARDEDHAMKLLAPFSVRLFPAEEGYSIPSIALVKVAVAHPEQRPGVRVPKQLLEGDQ